jgi:hypothetical protein
MTTDLNIAEIFHESGEIRFRYSRRMSADGLHWIREGLFREYHQSGRIIAEGHYANDHEHGLWREYYPNGQLAAEGLYESGQEVGAWRYWNPDGSMRIE